MKKLIVLLFVFLSYSLSAQILLGGKLLTTADSVLNVVSQQQWVTVAVYDTGAADTVTVWFPFTHPGGATTDTTTYAPYGRILDYSTGGNDVVLAGTQDTKVYILWAPYPRAIRFLLSDYASGDVYIRISGF